MKRNVFRTFVLCAVTHWISNHKLHLMVFHSFSTYEPQITNPGLVPRVFDTSCCPRQHEPSKGDRLLRLLMSEEAIENADALWKGNAWLWATCLNVYWVQFIQQNFGIYALWIWSFLSSSHCTKRLIWSVTVKSWWGYVKHLISALENMQRDESVPCTWNLALQKKYIQSMLWEWMSMQINLISRVDSSRWGHSRKGNGRKRIKEADIFQAMAVSFPWRRSRLHTTYNCLATIPGTWKNGVESNRATPDTNLR